MFEAMFKVKLSFRSLCRNIREDLIIIQFDVLKRLTISPSHCGRKTFDAFSQ